VAVVDSVVVLVVSGWDELGREVDGRLGSEPGSEPGRELGSELAPPPPPPHPPSTAAQTSTATAIAAGRVRPGVYTEGSLLVCLRIGAPRTLAPKAT
jgi:hypothetical protein